MQHLEGSGTPVLYIGRTVLKGLSIKKNPNDTIGNRTRDLPACSAVPQPTAPLCALRDEYSCELHRSSSTV